MRKYKVPCKSVCIKECYLVIYLEAFKVHEGPGEGPQRPTSKGLQKWTSSLTMQGTVCIKASKSLIADLSGV